MKRVLLIVITEGDVCFAPFSSALVESVKVGFSNDIEFFPVFFEANGNWSMAFNHGLTIAGKEKLDGAVCISPRVSWSAESLIEIVGRGHDSVALPVATPGGFLTRFGEIARLQDNGREIKVQSTSLDFIYLSAYAIDLLCQSHPTISYRGSDVKLILQSGDIYGAYVEPSEILAHRLREHGIEMLLNYKHTACRHDAVRYSQTFEEVLQQLKSDG
jgi:hypothetical protein